MNYDVEILNRKRVTMDRELVARKFDSLKLAIKAEAIAGLIRARMPEGGESRPLTLQDLVAYHNKLREEAEEE